MKFEAFSIEKQAFCIESCVNSRWRWWPVVGIWTIASLLSQVQCYTPTHCSPRVHNIEGIAFPLFGVWIVELYSASQSGSHWWW